MSIRKNVLIAISIIVLCMLLITQLFKNPAPPPASNGVKVDTSNLNSEISDHPVKETVRLSAVVYASPEHFQRLSERSNQFMADHSSIQIELTNLRKDQVYAYLKERAMSGDSPDIMLLDYLWINEFAASGFLSHQLKKHIQTNSSAVDEMVVWNGHTWAVPAELDPYIVAVNESAFADNWNGAAPRTSEEWKEFAKSRIAAGKPEGTIYIDPMDPLAFISLLWALDGEWSMADNGMYELSAGSVSLLDLLFGSEAADSNNGALLYSEPLSAEEMWSRFDDGSLPVLIIRLSELTNRKSDAGKYSYTMVPASDAGQGLWLAGAGYAVSSDSRHPAESFEWIHAMVEAGGDDYAGKVGRTFASDPEVRKKVEVIGSHMNELYGRRVPPAEWNARLSSLWKPE